MNLRPIANKQQYNKLVTHVIQSWEWGEFRKSLGIKVLRYDAFQITLHKIPFTNFNVGYLPKGPMPDQKLAEALKKIGKENNCAFIKIEPDVRLPSTVYRLPSNFIKSPKPLFTKYNFVVDLTKSEEELLKNMHPKTRYNIKVAQKHGVKVEERTDDRSFEIYLKLYFETTQRQGYHGHNEQYHRKAWLTLKEADTLYYPYGGSSKDHPEVMANNLVAWEAIKLGKKLGLKKFDMWGALGPNANPKDPFYGFHKFKQGYGGQLVEYLGTYDLVFNWPVYILFTAIDKLTPLKIALLKLFKK
ncbi:peptidoglycan bridge formation glycyltransferase FemA/FemB family protein [Candidatus Daviesbacteria bacterium]|nr:peptidoglycan bridge formation glycyltransferase FemA/FemB family protein [Candidatus Daviesbacteria bacterium]